MFKLFSKNYFSAFLTFLSLNTMMTSLMAEECCYPSECNRLYVGAFGGGIYSNSTKLIQRGTAFFPEDTGGPLAVDARAHSRKNSTGFGGAQIGYEWKQCPLCIGCSDWSITPAAEVEAYFYRHTKKGSLMNPSVRLPEHDFEDSFPMHMGLYLVNGVFTLNSCCLGKFSPYVGGGIGAAHISIRNAKSLQVAPPELGVNHFNSDRHDSTWTFAAQAKAGLRYNICERLHIFMEYRFSFVDSSNYTFGSTMYPTHAPTSTWGVDIKSIYYNAFAIGLQFDL
jgi:opacity protein-like surface antigen